MKCERPITLTSTVYRLWCKLRKDQWQLQLPFSMNYDRARPGAQHLRVTLARLMRQEINENRGRHGITILMDMSTFYDCIDLRTLASAARDLGYPSSTPAPKPFRQKKSCLSFSTLRAE